MQQRCISQVLAAFLANRESICGITPRFSWIFLPTAAQLQHVSNALWRLPFPAFFEIFGTFWGDGTASPA
jgi:hypothetical protein